MKNLKHLTFFGILLTLLLCIYHPCKGQSKTQLLHTEQTMTYEDFIVNDTLRRWKIGLNLPFFTKGLYDAELGLFDAEFLPVEFIVRRQTTMNQAIRARVFGMSDNYKRTEPLANFSTIETHKSIMGISLGYEWQTILDRRWKLYYGIDAQVKRIWDNYKEVDKDYYYEPTDETFVRTLFRFRTVDRVSTLPFIGTRFHIAPRFFVSMEVRVEAFYEKFKARSYSKIRELDGSLTDVFDNGGGTDNTFFIENSGIRFQPYSGIYLNFTL